MVVWSVLLATAQLPYEGQRLGRTPAVLLVRPKGCDDHEVCAVMAGFWQMAANAYPRLAYVADCATTPKACRGLRHLLREANRGVDTVDPVFLIWNEDDASEWSFRPYAGERSPDALLAHVRELHEAMHGSHEGPSELETILSRMDAEGTAQPVPSRVASAADGQLGDEEDAVFQEQLARARLLFDDGGTAAYSERVTEQQRRAVLLQHVFATNTRHPDSPALARARRRYRDASELSAASQTPNAE